MEGVKRADRRRRTVPLFVLVGLSILYTTYFARGFLIPIVLALLLKALLRPAVEFLRKLHIPYSIGAAFIVGSVFAGLVSGAYYLSAPASKWISEAPQAMNQIEVKFKGLIKPVAKITKTTEQFQEMTSIKETMGVQIVKLEPKKMSQMLLDATQDIVVIGLLVCVLIYFLLASNNLFEGKFLAILSPFTGNEEIFKIAESIRKDLSKYLFTIVVINACLGIAVVVMMTVLGLPNPILWGAMAGLLNFIPYAGATVSLGVIAMVSFLTFDHLEQSLIAPGIFLTLACVEGMVITPMVLGARLTLNPIAIFLGMLFWGWIWGIPGAFLAVPILMAIKIFCDRVRSLQVVGELLGH
jgi:predicted PurR-regulated permease PerM